MWLSSVGRTRTRSYGNIDPAHSPQLGSISSEGEYDGSQGSSAMNMQNAELNPVERARQVAAAAAMERGCALSHDAVPTSGLAPAPFEKQVPASKETQSANAEIGIEALEALATGAAGAGREEGPGSNQAVKHPTESYGMKWPSHSAATSGIGRHGVSPSKRASYSINDIDVMESVCEEYTPPSAIVRKRKSSRRKSDAERRKMSAASAEVASGLHATYPGSAAGPLEPHVKQGLGSVSDPPTQGANKARHHSVSSESTHSSSGQYNAEMRAVRDIFAEFGRAAWLCSPKISIKMILNQSKGLEALTSFSFGTPYQHYLAFWTKSQEIWKAKGFAQRNAAARASLDWYPGELKTNESTDDATILNTAQAKANRALEVLAYQALPHFVTSTHYTTGLCKKPTRAAPALSSCPHWRDLVELSLPDVWLKLLHLLADGLQGIRSSAAKPLSNILQLTNSAPPHPLCSPLSSSCSPSSGIGIAVTDLTRTQVSADLAPLVYVSSSFLSITHCTDEFECTSRTRSLLATLNMCQGEAALRELMRTGTEGYVRLSCESTSVSNSNSNNSDTSSGDSDHNSDGSILAYFTPVAYQGHDRYGLCLLVEHNTNCDDGGSGDKAPAAPAGDSTLLRLASLLCCLPLCIGEGSSASSGCHDLERHCQGLLHAAPVVYD
ncbi:unnamed protein product [Chrysoparadoxa australica]